MSDIKQVTSNLVLISGGLILLCSLMNIWALRYAIRKLPAEAVEKRRKYRNLMRMQMMLFVVAMALILLR